MATTDTTLGTCQCGCPASLHRAGYDYGRLKHTGCTVHRACTRFEEGHVDPVGYVLMDLPTPPQVLAEYSASRCPDCGYIGPAGEHRGCPGQPVQVRILVLAEKWRHRARAQAGAG